ncbi:MAG: WD40 repeat domain-containing protein [Chloroflexota bacterium]|nr:WD40 repeat domain-containing protein [Chloroflexota bacterium]
MKWLILIVIVVLGVDGSTSAFQQDDDVLTPTPLLTRTVGFNEISWSSQDNVIAVVPPQLETATQGQQIAQTTGDVELWQPFSSRGDLEYASALWLPDALVQTNEQTGQQRRFPTLFEFSPDGERLAMDVGELIMADVRTGEVLYTQPEIDGIYWNPDGTRLVSQDLNETAFTIVIWDANTGTELQRYRSPNRLPEGARPYAAILDFSWGTEEEIAFIANDDTRGILNLATGTVTDIYDCCIEEAFYLKWQPGGRLLATHDRVYDVDLRQPLFYFPHQSDVYWSPDGQWLIGDTGTVVSLISIADQRVMLRFSLDAIAAQYGDYVTNLVWSPDGQYIATITGIDDENGRRQHYVTIWDIQAIIAEAGYTLSIIP